MILFDSLRARWEAWRPSKAQAFWFAAGVVAATLVAGFGSDTWMTTAEAEKRIATAAQDARHELAAAVCASEYMQAAKAPERLAELQKLTWYARSEEIAKRGWATMPDRKEPNTVVAIACATRLTELKPNAH